MESLGATELAHLYDFVEEDDIIGDFILTPREDPLSESELTDQLKSFRVKRELASILSQFDAKQLVYRTFGTVSLLRKVTAKYDMIKRRLGQDAAVKSEVELQEEVLRLKRAQQFQADYWVSKVAGLQKEKNAAMTQARADFLLLVEERESDVRGLRAQVKALEAELKVARASRPTPAPRSQGPRLRTTHVMNFLHAHTTVMMNWPRLRDFLDHLESGTPVPPEWQTVITVMANDNLGFQAPSFVRLDPPADEDEETKESGPPPPGPVIDLSQGSPFKTSGSKHKRSGQAESLPKSRSKSSKVAPDQAQEFPTDWVPDSNSRCRPEESPLPLSSAKARAHLVDYPVVWKDLRPDLQLLMKDGLEFPDALDLINQDKCFHSRFPLYHLVTMLVSMMRWHRLDTALWTKYVPRRYLSVASVALDSLRKVDDDVPEWDGSLPSLNPDAAELEEDEDDDDDEAEDKDEEYDPQQDPDDGVDDEYDGDNGDDDADEISDHGEADDDDDGSPDGIPPSIAKRASKRRRLSQSSAESGTPKKLKPETTSKSSGRKKSRSGTKAESKSGKSKRRNPGGPTALAAKRPAKLTAKERRLIESPVPNEVSWMYFGVRMKPGSPTAHAPFQTLGFPDFEPNRYDLDILKDRCHPDELKEFLATHPWVKMSGERRAEFFFHRRSNLSTSAIKAIEDWIDFMEDNAEAFWHALHWIVLDRDCDSKFVRKLSLWRGKNHESVRKRAATKEKHIDKVVPASIWNELGIWKFPKRVCYWILMSRDHTKPGTDVRYTLKEQMELLDTREPARTEWGLCSSDDERIAHLPEDVRRTLIPAGQRDSIED
ncbi:uncharacterized protein IUM83_00001 [Phytophthora cinnamomi]|uniref:uncharacterized protein n=1 Tax=Phytophthora cinnamomi TaxID=4785 RepID=UPI00355A171C|nr:hypothetical protein IUM83_00001 [Phytophthora cinnamomi]